jgi:hypothetical protein
MIVEIEASENVESNLSSQEFTPSKSKIFVFFRVKKKSNDLILFEKIVFL